MKILLVNSTGVDPLFLTALMTIRKAGLAVRAVVPDRNRVWSGGSRTFEEPIHARPASQLDLGQELPDVWVCDGTPVDCLLAGLTKYRDTEFVVAGPHPHLTPAYHKRWSALLNIAQEANSHGLPVVAISTEHRDRWSNEALVRFSENFSRVFDQVVNLPARLGTVSIGPLNLNMLDRPKSHNPIIRLPIKPNRPSPSLTVSPLATANNLILVQELLPTTESEIEYAHVQGQHSLTLLTGL